MLQKQQQFKCRICRKRKPLCVDHDHKTKNVRGLLCRSCNAAIGALGDSYEGLLNAANYLHNA